MPKSTDAIMQPFDLEAETNAWRGTKSGNHSAVQHVEILIAFSGEARLM
jgi:hypothetical protein